MCAGTGGTIANRTRNLFETVALIYRHLHRAPCPAPRVTAPNKQPCIAAIAPHRFRFPARSRVATLRHRPQLRIGRAVVRAMRRRRHIRRPSLCPPRPLSLARARAPPAAPLARPPRARRTDEATRQHRAPRGCCNDLETARWAAGVAAMSQSTESCNSAPVPQGVLVNATTALYSRGVGRKKCGAINIAATTHYLRSTHIGGAPYEHIALSPGSPSHT